VERDEAVDRAVKALARRDHSSATLRAKLTRAGVSEDVSDDVLGTLRRAGYLDDARFARDRAAHLAAKGYGDAWIKGDLERSQGVEADAAIGVLDPEHERAAREWATASLRTARMRVFPAAVASVFLVQMEIRSN